MSDDQADLGKIIDDALDGADTGDTEQGSVATAPEGSAVDGAVTEGEADTANLQPIDPPAFWDAAQKAQFAEWPRNVQEVVSDRYKAMEADYTRKTQEAADIRRSAEPLLQAVAPYNDYLNQIAPSVGQTPHQMIGSLLGVEYQLRTGTPEQKYMALAQIAQSYGLDLAALAGGQIPYTDPASLQQRQFVEQQAQRINQLEQSFERQQDEQLNGLIGNFAALKDEHGQPKYPYFDTVRATMGQILMQAADEGRPMSMEEAYSQASAPIEAAINAQLQARTNAASQQRQQAVDKAKLASTPKGSGSQPGGSAKAKDLDSILSDAMAAHGM